MKTAFYGVPECHISTKLHGVTGHFSPCQRVNSALKCFHDRIPGSSPQLDVERKARDCAAAALDDIRQGRIFNEVFRESAEIAKDAHTCCEEPTGCETENRERIRSIGPSVASGHEVLAALEHLAGC